MPVIEPTERVVRPAPSERSEWTWDRPLPIAPRPPARARRGLRTFPALTWVAALAVTLLFAALVVLV
jgi:hypothetical protein